jgi:hypothetical protein
MSYKRFKYFFQDDYDNMRYWNIFDLSLVSLMVVENCILYYIMDSGSLGVLSALRLLR